MKRNYKNLKWLVWERGSEGITTYNMLNEYSYTLQYIQECLKKKTPILASEILHVLQWKYWARSECEVLIKDLHRDDIEKKVDWFMQVAMNFEPFLQYLERELQLEIVRDKCEDKNWMWE